MRKKGKRREREREKEGEGGGGVAATCKKDELYIIRPTKNI